MRVGSKVKIETPADAFLNSCVWWPKGDVTGLVQKLHKNGNVAVAIDQLPNRSDDGRKTMNIPVEWLQEI